MGGVQAELRWDSQVRESLLMLLRHKGKIRARSACQQLMLLRHKGKIRARSACQKLVLLRHNVCDPGLHPFDQCLTTCASGACVCWPCGAEGAKKDTRP